MDEQVTWLTPQEQKAWRAFLRGHRVVFVGLDEALTKHGVRLTEYEIISMLSEAPGGRLRMSALADIVVQSRSRLTHTATRLERLGWVERHAVREDRRGVELTLTTVGWELLERLAPLHVQSVRDVIVDQLEPEEFTVLGQLMTRIIEAADQRAQDDTPAEKGG